jgi:hypothetical protein
MKEVVEHFYETRIGGVVRPYCVHNCLCLYLLSRDPKIFGVTASKRVKLGEGEGGCVAHG